MIPFAAAVVVKATVVTLAALAVTRTARRTRAAVRHVVLAAAFAVLLALPLTSLLAPAVSLSLPGGVAAPLAAFRTDAYAVPDGDLADMRGARGRDAAAVTVPGSPWPSWPLLAGGLWALGAFLFLIPVATGLAEVRRLRRAGLRWRRGQSLVDSLRRDLGIRRRVDVLLDERVAGPMTCGIVRPAIVLPTDARFWNAENLWRAVVHELEHVRRGDWAVQVAARGATSIYWFHPLVWLAWRELSLEAERACDDAVLRGAHPAEYADQLVHLAERLSAAASSGHALAMAGRHDLSARVRAVLDTGQRRGRAGVAAVAATCAAAAVVAVAISPLRLVASQQASLTPAPPQQFSAVTMKPCSPQPMPSGAGGRGRGGGGNVTASPGSLTIDCMTVQSMIDRAYVFFGEPLLNESGPPTENSPRVQGGPPWIRNETFTLEARADAAADRKMMMGPMLRAFLEDRLQLKLHRDVEEAPAYTLTIAKSGLKMKAIGSDAECTPRCGSVERAAVDGKAILRLGGMRLDVLMVVLKLGRRVIDRTGVPDGARFNVLLQYPEDATFADAEPSPSLFRAVEQQLGLKLDPIKAPHGIIVIDRVVHP
jgi:uncharacterized protein (TIGR03435 family)